jgi:hypothetical protein
MYGLKRSPHRAWRYERVGQCYRRQIMALFLILMTISHLALALRTVTSSSTTQAQPLMGRAADNSSLLECLQVAPPILSSDHGCQQTLMVHTFAFSYGQPFIGKSKVHTMESLHSSRTSYLYLSTILQPVLIDSFRQLLSASLRLQSCCSRAHSYFRWTAV